MFVRVTLRDGSRAVTEYTRVRNLPTYAAEVFGGRKPLSLWRPADENRHPISGEPCLIRTRVLIPGAEVTKMEQVMPNRPDHNFDPDNFDPIPVIQGTQRRNGLFRFKPDDPNLPELAVPGIDYPRHFEGTGYSQRSYVILQAEMDGEPEVRHYLEASARSHREEWHDAEGDEDDED